MTSVDLDRQGPVAVLTVANPEVKNALTTAMAVAIIAACEEVDSDDAIGCLVVRGSGGTFSSGADTREWARSAADFGKSAGFASSDTMYDSFLRLGRVRVPTIAAVRGAAVGAGLNLALSTDLRIVASNARLLAGFIRAGIHPGGGFFTICSRVAGREAAAAMGVFGEPVSGTRAVELGLAWEAVEDGAVESRAMEIGGRVAQDPFLARRVVHSFRLQAPGGQQDWAAGVEAERGVQMWSQVRRIDAAATGTTT